MSWVAIAGVVLGVAVLAGIFALVVSVYTIRAGVQAGRRVASPAGRLLGGRRSAAGRHRAGAAAELADTVELPVVRGDDQ